MTHIKLITLDLDNTLWPTEDVIRQAEADTSAWLIQQFPEHARTLCARNLRDIRLALLARHPEYRHQMSDLRRAAMQQTLVSLGIDAPQATRLSHDAFDIFMTSRNQVAFFPGVRETLEKLASQWPLGAITNGNADLEKIGIRELFAFHHSAETVGRGKPDARIFQAALDSARCQAEQTLHIGDHPLEDIDGARALGFHTAWANFLDAPWPDSVARADEEVHTFTDIPDLLLLQD